MKARASLRELFKEIGILTAASQYILNCILFIQKNITEFKKKSDIHQINTRNKNKLAIPAFRLNKVFASFMGQGIHFYVPDKYKELPYNKFKDIVKDHMLKKAYYTTRDFLNDKSSWE